MKKNYMPMGMKQMRKTAIIHHRSAQQKREDDLLTGSYHLALLLSVAALHDEFDFGTKRLERFIDRVHDKLENYKLGHSSVSDIAQMIYDETGIQIMRLDLLKDEDYIYREDRK